MKIGFVTDYLRKRAEQKLGDMAASTLLRYIEDDIVRHVTFTPYTPAGSTAIAVGASLSGKDADGASWFYQVPGGGQPVKWEGWAPAFVDGYDFVFDHKGKTLRFPLTKTIALTALLAEHTGSTVLAYRQPTDMGAGRMVWRGFVSHGLATRSSSSF